MAVKKLSRSLITKLSKVIRKGATIDAACKASNINKSTYFRWMKDAENIDNKMAILFKGTVDKALAEYEMELLDNIKIHSAKSWQAGAWILERRFRNKYGKEADIQDGNDTTTQEVDDKFL